MSAHVFDQQVSDLVRDREPLSPRIVGLADEHDQLAAVPSAPAAGSHRNGRYVHAEPTPLCAACRAASEVRRHFASYTAERRSQASDV